MEYANINKKHYCGVDLHARTMFLCIMTAKGKIVVHREVATAKTDFLRVIEPFRKSIGVCVESTFNWYWLSDLCRVEGIPFLLGHALYIKAISRNKKKDDKIDSRTLADLLRTQLFPIAYPYPAGMRETRDLLRRRHTFVTKRTGLARHIKILLYQQGYSGFPEHTAKAKKIREYVHQFKVPDSVALSIQNDIAIIEVLDKVIAQLEWAAHLKAEKHDIHSIALLQTIKGLGEILSLTILYEMHTVKRFATVQKFSSYARVVRPHRCSAGKRTASRNSKIGNPCLCWAFHQLAASSTRYHPEVRKLYARMKQRSGSKKALAYLAHKFAVAVYYMLKNKEPFNIARFVAV